MKSKILTLALAIIAVGFLGSCKKSDPVVVNFEEILVTNPAIPEVENTTPPANAWVNSLDPACKGFIGVFNNDKHFILRKTDKSGNSYIGMDKADPFEKIDDNTYISVQAGWGTFYAYMTDGKLTSIEYQPEADCKFAYLAGRYSAPVAD